MSAIVPQNAVLPALLQACYQYAAKNKNRPAPQVFPGFTDSVILLVGGNNTGKSQILAALSKAISKEHQVLGYTKTQRNRSAMIPVFATESNKGSGEAMLHHITQFGSGIDSRYKGQALPLVFIMDGVEESLDDESEIALAATLTAQHTGSFRFRTLVVASHSKNFIKALIHYQAQRPTIILLGEATEYPGITEWLEKTVAYPDYMNTPYSEKDIEFIMKQKSEQGLVSWRAPRD